MGAKHGIGPFSSAGSAGSTLDDAGFGLLGQPGGPEDGVGVNILPNDMCLRGDLEEAARSSFADQCVAIGQPLEIVVQHRMTELPH
jgi:hypothetical protein